MRTLQPDDVLLGLGVSIQASAIIAHGEIVDEDGRPRRLLFIRRLPSGEYTSMSEALPAISQHWFGLAVDAPLLFISEYSKDGANYDWVRLVRVDLLSGEQTELLTGTRKWWPSGAIRGWVTKVLHVSSTGDFLICVRALEWSTQQQQTRVIYDLVHLDTRTGAMNSIAPLDHLDY